MKKLRVTVDGKVFDVIVEMSDHPAGAPRAAVTTPIAPPPSAGAAPAAPVAAPSAPTAAHGPVGASAGAVPSPLAGKVVSVDVKLGDTVSDGAQLVTLEAMKMNTFVYAGRSGVVSAIHVKSGDAVEEGAALLVIG